MASWSRLFLDTRGTDHAQRYWRAPAHVSTPVRELNADIPPEELARLAEFMPTPCWLARPDGYIVWYNRRWHGYCGTTPDAMEGWGWQSVHDPEELPKVLERWTRCIAAAEPFEMLFPLKGADGTYRPFLTRAVPLLGPDGDVVRWFGVNTEIGDQVRAESALRASEARFQVLTDAMPQMVWSTRPDGHHDYFNAQWYAFTGVPSGSTDGDGWSELFHPDDRESAWAKWSKSLQTGEPYEVEYRLRHRSGEYRWTLGRALPVRGADGEIIRWIGTCTDIDAAKRDAEQLELLSRELSHRIKNIFAVISGLVNLAGRREPTLRSLATELLGRIAALGRAHDFARPHSEWSRPEVKQTTLGGLIAELLHPYEVMGAERFRIIGDAVHVDDKGATPIALVIHELATNSAKYGSLSTPEGRIEVEIATDANDVSIRWTEVGGPPVGASPTRSGFGTELADLGIRRQLGGSIERDWQREGLIVTIRVQKDRLSRSAGLT